MFTSAPYYCRRRNNMAPTQYQRGLWAEALAGFYFLLKGYSILKFRFKTHVGEIDLVTKKGKTLVFVEVKLRQTGDIAAESIHAKNQSRVRRAAELYLQKHPQYTGMGIRFDALVLAPGAWPRHIENAW
jgi:putative endonuclease